MKRNMREWLDAMRESPVKKAMPVLSFPAVQLMGISVRELISDSEAQARGWLWWRSARTRPPP